MTLRSILLGLLGACIVCGFTYFNDAVMHQTYFVGNNMPIAVYGGLILFILLINPLLLRLSRRAALSGRELAVVLALTLAACCVPGSGLMRTFTATLVMPHHLARTESGWQSQGVVDLVPPRMLAEVTTQNQSDVLNGFIQGLARPEDQRHVSIGDMPWSAWTAALAFWLPVILTFWIGLIALSLVLHRQWAHHEQLPYPVAAFVHSLLPEKGAAVGGVFRSRLFWTGAAIVSAVHLNNVAHAYFPEYLVRIETGMNFTALLELMPTMKLGQHSGIFNITIYPTVVALTFFLATDVSLSMGIGPFLYCYVTGTFTRYGVSLTGGWFEPRITSFLNFGAYLGSFISILFIGRHYYLLVMRRALRLGGTGRVEVAVVWSARVFLAAAISVVLMLWGIGIEWYFAALYTGLTVMLFVVMARIMAETGAYFIQPWWSACTIIAGIFGFVAVGPKTFLMLMLISTVLVIDPREALMPFIVNSMKFLDLRRLKLGRAALACTAALVLGVAVAVPVTLYFQYDRGMNKTDGWATEYVPKAPFEEAVRVQQQLTTQGQLGVAESASGWRRLSHWAPNKPRLFAAACGMVLVFAVTAARLRFAHWPLHPVLFLVWTSYPGRAMAASFLIGWLIKVAVMRYGGAAGCQRLKPLMFGLIAGDMIGGTIPIVIGLVHYYLSGELPTQFRIMPA